MVEDGNGEQPANALRKVNTHQNKRSKALHSPGECRKQSNSIGVHMDMSSGHGRAERCEQDRNGYKCTTEYRFVYTNKRQLGTRSVRPTTRTHAFH